MLGGIEDENVILLPIENALVFLDWIVESLMGLLHLRYLYMVQLRNRFLPSPSLERWKTVDWFGMDVAEMNLEINRFKIRNKFRKQNQNGHHTLSLGHLPLWSVTCLD